MMATQEQLPEPTSAFRWSGYFKSTEKRERVKGVRGKETSVKERRGDELVSRYPLEI